MHDFLAQTRTITLLDVQWVGWSIADRCRGHGCKCSESQVEPDHISDDIALVPGLQSIPCNRYLLVTNEILILL
jgi:hypothetical protein